MCGLKCHLLAVGLRGELNEGESEAAFSFLASFTSSSIRS
jgi:hypothetical protein